MHVNFFKKQTALYFNRANICEVIALPQYLYIQLAASTFKLSINVGYLVNKLNPLTFLNYWIQNLGFNFILIPLGFFFANKFAKKILIAFFSLFIIGKPNTIFTRNCS